MADQDNDMKANKEEFTAFLHPEEYEHMKDIVVLVSYTLKRQPCSFCHRPFHRQIFPIFYFRKLWKTLTKMAMDLLIWMNTSVSFYHFKRWLL